MRMASEQRIAADRQKVWDALNDPEILRASIPGCNSLDKVSEERFDAVVEVKVGPIGARFKGAVSLTNLDPPNKYTLLLEGNGGIAGSMKGSADVRLVEDNGGTIIVYEVDAQVGGRMAQLGGPIIDATAKQLAGKFFSRFGEIVAAGGVEAQAAKAAPPALAGAASADSVRSARSAAAPATSGGFPIVWILSCVIVALSAFMVGRSQGTAGSDWAGLAIGLLVVVVAAAAFEYGRRAATPDLELLRRLIEEARK